MTSNIGTAEGGKPGLGFGGKDGGSKSDYRNYLKQFFRPEFLNRLDDVITFNTLGQDTLAQILDLQLTEVYERLAEQKLTLALTDEARAFLLEEGHDPVNGARPLRRAVERLVTRPISTKILEEAFPPGATVRVKAGDGELVFEAVEANESA